VAYATDVASSATRSAMQTLGGHGYISEHPTELWYRNAATLSTLDTDPLLSTFQAAL
jgi:alkylation response protein AidB-like acyl-CoA dehydrogenase